MAIELISKIKPKNGGNFPLADAADVVLEDGRNLEDVINEILSRILPAVSVKDNGKVMKVVGGQWKLVSCSGGGETDEPVEETMVIESDGDGGVKMTYSGIEADSSTVSITYDGVVVSGNTVTID